MRLSPEPRGDGSGAQDGGYNLREISVEPEREAMTNPELKRFGAALKATAADLKSAILNREAIAIETNSDMLDQIQRSTERELALGRLERETNVMREVRAALCRIQANTFGICVDRQNEIGLRRLNALPWTRSCIACQEAADLGWKQHGEEWLLNAA